MTVADANAMLEYLQVRKRNSLFNGNLPKKYKKKGSSTSSNIINVHVGSCYSETNNFVSGDRKSFLAFDFSFQHKVKKICFQKITQEV